MFGYIKKYKSTERHRILAMSILCLFGFSLCITGPASVYAQNTGNGASEQRKQPAKKSKVYLLHSDMLKKSSSVPDAQIVVGNVKFRHDSLYMYCDSAYYYEKISSFEAFSNVKMVQGDTLFLYGDRLYYDGLSQIAEVRNNVRMENKNTTLLTDSLNYDRVYNLGYYFNGGSLMDDKNVLTSDWGEFSPSTKQAVFNYDVRLVNSDFTLTSDTLKYNSASKIVDIVGPSNIESDKNNMYSEKGQYNTMSGIAELYDRSVLISEGTQLTGDSLFYNNKTGIGEAMGNMVMNDTVNRNMITGGYAYYDEDKKYSYAIDNAVAIDYSQGDSLFLHADTLMLESFHLDTDSMYREIRAFHRVKFFRQDVQGAADSLVFSSVDTCLTMYKDPILWTDNQQLVGESIKIYMNDSTIDWAHIINQALSVEHVKGNMYNQVSGKEMKSYFKNGDMRKTEIIGSVRVVYYPMDSDSTLIGMNVSETSQLDIYLQNKKLDKMVMFPKSNGTLYPMSQIPAGKDKLDNFAWFDYIRPLSKEDIFRWVPKKAEDQLKKNVRAPVKLPNDDLFEK